jgi:hypothetical protein
MNKRIDHISNFLLELKTLILGINTKFGLYKDTKIIGKFSKGSERMSNEAEQFKCVSRLKPNAITHNQYEVGTIQPTQLPPPKDSRSTPNPMNNDKPFNDVEVNTFRFS